VTLTFTILRKTGKKLKSMAIASTDKNDEDQSHP